MKYLILLFITFSIFSRGLGQTPVIHSFAPLAAPAGADVIIQGNNFSSDPANNIVYFGTVKATVTNASPTSLTATVPFGSVYDLISVKVDSLTAFSREFFTTMYGSSLQLRNNSFKEPATISGARQPCFADLDNDGRLDMVSIINNNRIAVYRNTDSAGDAAFGTATLYATTTSPVQVIAADFNADGKLDIAVAGTGNASVWIYQNISTAGNIAFNSPVYYLLSGDNYPYTLDANDIDGDGKTDLIISYAHQGTCFSVARSTTTGGNISFAARVNFAFGTVPGGAGNVGDANKIYVADIDGDGKADVTSMSRFFPPFLIYRNTSVPGTISFAPKVSITSNRNITIGNGFFDMKLADVDGDSKPDIVYASSDSAYLSVYRNTSTVGNISYTSKMNFAASYFPVYLAANDLNGDGKPDIALLSQDSVYVYENTSSAANISFWPQRPFAGIFYVQEIALADIDNNGKTDMIISGDINSGNVYKSWQIKNIIDESAPIFLCPITASAVLEPGRSGSNYQWQLNTGSGFVNVTDDVHHSGATSANLTLLNPPSSWTGYEYRCVVDGVNAASQVLRFRAVWTGNFNSIWENPLNWKCGQLPDNYTDVVVRYDNVTIYAGTTVRTVTIATGASVTVRPGVVLNVTN